jgi:hypothetical protein
MFDPYRQAFLSLRDNLHILRKVQHKPEVAAAKAAQGYTNLVIAIADARGQPPINAQKERDLIDQAVGDLLSASLDLIVQLKRGQDGRRFVSEIVNLQEKRSF